MKPGKRAFPKIALALVLVVSLSAFRHTDIEGYTDPEFTDFRFKTVVVQMPNASLGFRNLVIKRLAKEFKKQHIRMLLHNDLFPPTRQWSADATREIYEQYDVDAGLVITLGSIGSKSTPGMVMYNESTYNGMTSGYATQVTYVRDHASFEIALVDAESRQTVWIGNLDTRGAGMLFVGSKSTAKGLVKGLIREWKSTGMIHR